jgi:uncharacterized repeat protein (TIGR02543 family)
MKKMNKKWFWIFLMGMLFVSGCENQPTQIELLFDSNGGSIVEKMLVDITDQALTLPTPTKDGYTFDGWYLELDGSEEFSITSIANQKTITLFAKWSIKTYTVTFHLDGGAVVTGEAVQTIEHGNSAIPPSINKEGQTYTWSGNFTQVTQNVDVYATWEAMKYTISFDTQGGNNIEPVSLKVGETINLTQIPIRDGFEFAGWYESVNSIEEFSETTMPNNNIVLFADWGTIGLLYELIQENQYYEVSSGEFTDYEHVQIPKKYNDKYVTKIANSGFSNCGSIESIIIPESIITIGNYAFLYNSSLVTIELPNSLEVIGENAFRFCYQLIEFVVNLESQHFMVEDGILYSKDEKTLVRYPLAKTDTSYSISNKVEVIGSDAFGGNRHLTQVNIGPSVHTIKSFAFYDCSELTSIDIPNHVVILEYQAFRDCVKLTSVTFGTGLTSIESYVFQNCVKLVAIIIPANIRYIRYGAFYNCSRLSSVTIEQHTSGNLVEGGSFMFAYTAANLQIYVGSESLVTAYKANYYWGSYRNSIVVGE